MPDVSGNSALEVVVGLFFLYFLLSIFCWAMKEGIVWAFNLRAMFLERVIWRLFDGETNARFFYDHWRINALIKPSGRVLKRVRKPSHIPPRLYALTILDIFAPSAQGQHTLVERTAYALKGDGTPQHSLPPTVRGQFIDGIEVAAGDSLLLRKAIEETYNDAIEQGNGWYNTRVQVILFACAFVLVLLVNADSFSLARRLWNDTSARAAALTQVNRMVSSGRAHCAKKTGDETPASLAVTCVEDVNRFPLGWSHNTSHGVLGTEGKVFGLLVSVLAVALGAPFWIGLLGKAIPGR